MKRQIITDTPVSYLITAVDDAIVECRPVLDAGPVAPVCDDALLREAERQLRHYFAGTLRDFDLPVTQSGTPFRQAVWRALGDISYGETVSYADVARMVRRPEAVRAVANAVAANGVHIITPCHRVIRSDGSIGGYAGGVELKRRLLEIEFLNCRGDVNSK